MRTSQCLACQDFPCSDVQHAGYLLPDVDLDPARISAVMISESAPPARADYFYAGPPALFERTTVEVFNLADLPVRSVPAILALGVYLTTAVKCAKTGPGLQTANLALLKDTSLSEGKVLQFLAEVFNALNHANFNLPDNFYGSPTFGKIQTAGAPRRIQFGLKFVF